MQKSYILKLYTYPVYSSAKINTCVQLSWCCCVQTQKVSGFGVLVLSDVQFYIILLQLFHSDSEMASRLPTRL